MEDMALQMEAIAYNAAISACEKGFQWTKALHLLRQLRRSIVTYAALVTACGKCEEWRQVQALLDELQRLSMEATLGRDGAEEWQLALAFFQNLQETSAPINVPILAAALDTCHLGGRFQQLTQLAPAVQRRTLRDLRQKRRRRRFGGEKIGETWGSCG
eukprot:Skav216529  [mRNA]  locus=scaffold1003:329495:332782:- [translate_table: standard]